jgi:hypothetical protein
MENGSKCPQKGEAPGKTVTGSAGRKKDYRFCS